MTGGKVPPRKKTDAKAVQVPELASRPELFRVAPTTLTLGPNVRLDARLSPAFVASIRERGVLEPIVAHRDSGGRLIVLRGSRRTLAAVQAGVRLVPVIVIDMPDEPDRLVDQVVENEHRESLTLGERVGAYEQLAVLGVTAAQIAKRMAAPRADVDAALAVARSQAREAITSHAELTIEQAAVLAEFDGDAEAMTALVGAVHQGGFDHTVQRLRDRREEADAVAALARELRAAGVLVVDMPPWSSPVKRLDQLRGDINVEQHASCPGHAAYIDVDWRDDIDDDAQPEQDDTDDVDEYADEDTVAMVLVCEAVYVCTDVLGNGHELSTRFGGVSSPARPSDDERAAERAARREVIEGNRAWDSAEKVRRAWLRQFASRKTAPRGSSAFVAAALGWCEFALGRARERGNELAHELLGLKAPGYGQRGESVAAALEGTSEARAEVIALTLVLGAYEEATTRDSWRRVEAGTARYLRFLADQGYELSDVERRAAGLQEAQTSG